MPTSETVGHLLCSGLFSMDTLSKWFAAVALSHALVDNPTQKEQLLRVQLATRMGSPAISLMNQCSQMLQQVTTFYNNFSKRSNMSFLQCLKYHIFIYFRKLCIIMESSLKISIISVFNIINFFKIKNQNDAKIVILYDLPAHFLPK